MKNQRRLLVGLVLAAASFAQAQDADTTPTDQKPAADSQTQDEQAAPAVPKPVIDVAWSSRHVSGDFHRFAQYGIPPDGPYLRGLTFDSWTADLRTDGLLWLRDVGQPDYYTLGGLSFNYGKTRFSSSDRRNEFYDPSPQVFPRSEREISDVYLRQAFGRDLSVAVKGRKDQQDQFFEGPKDSFRQRTYTWTADAGGQIAGGFGALQFTDWHYFDRTNVEPDNRVQMWGVTYARDFGSKLSAEGQYYHSTTKPSGGAENRVSVAGFNAAYDFDDNTRGTFQYRREFLHLPTIQNSYVRDRGYVQGSVSHRMGGWLGELSYRRLDVERVNADQTFVDAPTWHTFEGRISGKLSPNVRLTTRAVRETLDGKFGMQTDDNRALYWRNRLYGQVSLDANMDTSDAYLIFTFNEKRNDGRDSRVREQSYTLGASTQPQPNFDLYLEVSNDAWTARTSDPNNPNLSDYFPDSTTYVFGTNLTFNPACYGTLNYTEFVSDNANPLLLPQGNVRGRFLTTGLHMRSKAGYELGLSFVPWKVTDKVYSQWGYDSTLITLSANVKF